MSHNLYSSKNVVVLKPGEDVSPETEAFGYDRESCERIRDFVDFVITSAKVRLTGPEELVNAMVSVIAFNLLHVVPAEHRTELVSTLVEAFCILGGGESDMGRKQ